MVEQVKIIPATLEHYSEIVAIYNECFLPKFGFVTKDKEKQHSFADDFGLVNLNLKNGTCSDTYFIAVDTHHVLGVICLKHTKQEKEVFTPNLPFGNIIKRYGFFGLIKALLLGWAIYYKPKKGELYIDSIGVAAAARGKGIGSKLLDFAVRFAKFYWFKTISLCVMFENIRAKKLYETIGFQVYSTRLFRWLKKTSGYSGCYRMVRSMQQI